MENLQTAPILELSETAERCVKDYEALYQHTKLSIEGHKCCSTPLPKFSQESVEDHGSDADDEITDFSDEYLSSSNELCVTPKEYVISSGSKPLSLVIRRCDTPTAEGSSPSIETHTIVPLSDVKESENTCTKVSNLISNVNNTCQKKDKSKPACIDRTNLKDVDVALLSTKLDTDVRNFQEGIFSSSQESSHSVVTQEYIENVINESDLQIGICSTHTLENYSHIHYAGSSLPIPSKALVQVFGDNTNGNNSKCSAFDGNKSGRIVNDSSDNMENLQSETVRVTENIQFLCDDLTLDYGKKENQTMFNHITDQHIQLKNVTYNIEESGGHMSPISLANEAHRYESETSVVAMDNNLLCAENMNDLTLHAKPETFNVHSETSTIQHDVIDPIVEVQSTKGLVISKHGLKFKNYDLTLLQFQESANATLNEANNEVITIVNQDTEIKVNGDSCYKKDFITPISKSVDFQLQVRTEIGSILGEKGFQYDQRDSETGSLSVCDLFPMHDIDCASKEVENRALQDVPMLLITTNVKENVFLTSVEPVNSFMQIENFGESEPETHSEHEQDGSVKDESLEKKTTECLFEDKEELVQSSVYLGSKMSVMSVEMDNASISEEIVRNQSTVEETTSDDDRLEDNTNFLKFESGSVSMDELALTNTDCFGDQFSKLIERDISQSSAQAYNTSVLVQSFTEDAMDCPYNDASDTVIDHSPLLFSAEDENSYYTETASEGLERTVDKAISEEWERNTMNFENTTSKEQRITGTVSNCDKIMINEQKKLHRLQEALMGVPPPPSVTNPQMNVGDIIRLLKENKHLMISTDITIEEGGGVANYQKSPLQSLLIEQIKNSSWPELKSCCYYDIQYNHGPVSEEFETLCQKLRERYVGCETTSSCNVWYSRDISSKVNNATNKRRSTGQSPGRRLSHLARRRHTFSSANLLNSVAGQLPGNRQYTSAERRLIMVELKKNEHRQRCKNYQPRKLTSSADCNKLLQTKRALFKSPPNNHRRLPSASKSRSGSKKSNKSEIDQSRIRSSKRALWPSTSTDTFKVGYDRALTNLSGQINAYGKRRREDSGPSAQRSKYPRRMLFDDVAARGNSDFLKTDIMTGSDENKKVINGENEPQVPNHTQSVPKDLYGGLSESHRKKLLWAVAEALRAEGINMSHHLFRPCATSLVRLVRNDIPDLTCKREGSTSDLMLRLAKEHVKEVTKK